MLFLIILFSVVIVVGVAILYMEKMRGKREKGNKKKNNSFNEKVCNISEFYQVKDIYNGILYKDDQCYKLAKMEGLNFTVLSKNEQETRESALIGILTRLDYPVRFITNTVIADTSEEARKIAGIAAQTPEGKLRTYRTLYAGQLEIMRTERMVTTQSTYLIIPGSNEKEVEDRLNLIASSLRQQAIIITPLNTTEEVYDTIQEILMPEKITKPSQIAFAGVAEPIYFSDKDVV